MKKITKQNLLILIIVINIIYTSYTFYINEGNLRSLLMLIILISAVIYGIILEKNSKEKNSDKKCARCGKDLLNSDYVIPTADFDQSEATKNGQKVCEKCFNYTNQKDKFLITIIIVIGVIIGLGIFISNILSHT